MYQTPQYTTPLSTIARDEIANEIARIERDQSESSSALARIKEIYAREGINIDPYHFNNIVTPQPAVSGALPGNVLEQLRILLGPSLGLGTQTPVMQAPTQPIPYPNYPIMTAVDINHYRLQTTEPSEREVVELIKRPTTAITTDAEIKNAKHHLINLMFRYSANAQICHQLFTMFANRFPQAANIV
jgi:hypothetical protein